MKFYNLISHEIDNYDLIFKCRFDSLYFTSIKFIRIGKILKFKKIYYKLGEVFFSERIYNIFFGGQKESIIRENLG